MKLIVGLGNPGLEYENTRHNIGFMAIDNYAKAKNISITKEKFGGMYAVENIGKEKVVLLKPQMYMNLSGEVVKKFVEFYKIDINDILIIEDDLDLEIGKYKLKSSGSSGGHNGLKNIENLLKTTNYKRLKIGISNNKDIDTKEYVLGKIRKSDLDKYNDIFEIVNNIIDDFLLLDFERIMSKYNHK
ncbi:MAG: aminoacyl-tRNA hydrolase [Bacilli bacterium]